MSFHDDPLQPSNRSVPPSGSPWDRDDRELVDAIVKEYNILHWWGATQSIVRHLPGLIGHGPFARPITFLDVGIGNGRLAIAIVQWCRKQNIPIRILGLEFHPATVELARRATEAHPEIEIDLADPRFKTGVSQSLNGTNGQYDFVVASQVLHYFSPPQQQEMIRYLYAMARSALLVGEIVKHPAVYSILWVLTRIVTHNQTLQMSLLESVSNTCSIDGWRQLFTSIGVPVIEIFPHWPSLVCIIAPKMLEEPQTHLSVLDAVPSIAPTG